MTTRFSNIVQKVTKHEFIKEESTRMSSGMSATRTSGFSIVQSFSFQSIFKPQNFNEEEEEAE